MDFLGDKHSSCEWRGGFSGILKGKLGGRIVMWVHRGWVPRVIGGVNQACFVIPNHQTGFSITGKQSADLIEESNLHFCILCFTFPRICEYLHYMLVDSLQ